MSFQALYTAAAGMSALQTRLDVIANNIANSETTGFKSSRANFEDLFYRQEKMPGQTDATGLYTPTGIALGTGSRVQSTQTNFAQGSLQQTGNQLDVAIQGTGLFQVKDPTGTIYYTRAGNFSQNATGNIVVGSASVGRMLQPQITIPADGTNVTITSDGKVMYQTSTSQTLQQAGQIQLANFINPQGLLQIGENLFAESDASGNAVLNNPGVQGTGTLQQSSLELSNVDPVSSLIDLITTQRSYEMNSQAIQAGNEVLQTVNALIK